MSNTNQTYFDLKIHPKQIIEKMYFTQDEKDPPKLVATQIIKIVKSILEDFTYIKAIDEIFFTIEKSDENENYISKGHLVYENKNSHSTIESYYLFQKLVQTFGSILR